MDWRVRGTIQKEEGEIVLKRNIEDYPMVLTAKEIGEILKVSKPTAYELMNRSDFPLKKLVDAKGY